MISIIGGILLLCVLIVVHEFGHFIVAKLLGVRVLTFSVGFGPKLLKWTKGGTEYALSAIPLGGYIKMVGESPTDELTEEEKGVSFLYQPIWKKSLIALAGPLFNLILPIFLLTFIYFGKESLPLAVVGTTIPGEVAALAGLQHGDRILKVDGVPVETFIDFNKEISAKPSQRVKVEIERGVAGKTERKTLELTPTALPDPNPVNVGEKVGHIGISQFERRPRVAVLDKASPAAVAGLKTFDEIVSVNGQAVRTYDELEKMLPAQKFPIRLKVKRGEDAKAAELEVVINAGTGVPTFAQEPGVSRYAVIESEIAGAGFTDIVAKTQKNIQDFSKRSAQMYGISFVDGIIQNVGDSSAASKVAIKAGDRIVSINGKPVETWFQIMRLFQSDAEGVQVLGVVGDAKARVIALRLQMPATKKSFGPAPTKQLGVVTSMGEAYKQGAMLERNVGVFEAVARGAGSTWDLSKTVAKSFFLLAGGSVSVSEIGGPLTMFSVASEATSHGVQDTLIMMSLISVNLGILNLLPIPMLDGGHLLLFFIEFVTRRPLTLRTRQVAMSIGLTFILMLMAVALFNDFSRLIG